MPLSRLYGAIANVRNTLYEKGVFKSISLGVPTISVGNITVGGTGKTPLVAYIAEHLAARGERVCVLTRGYGRENPRHRVLVSDTESILVNPKQAGDEPFELAMKLLGKASVISDANRVSAGIWARKKFGITAFVLDDAFQHQKVKRDLNIVTIDATNPFGSGKNLPFGILREPLSNLNRADLIVITRANLSDEVSNLTAQISKYNPNCQIVTCKNMVRQLVDIRQFRQNPKMDELHEKRGFEKNSGKKIFAFCALGNPENFFEQLKCENFQIVSTKVFPDHHFYDVNDIRKIAKSAAESGAEAIFTTLKDAVKLQDFDFELPCFVVNNELVFDDEKKLRQSINAVFSN